MKKIKHSGEYDGQIKITTRIKCSKVKRLLLRLEQCLNSRQRFGDGKIEGDSHGREKTHCPYTAEGIKNGGD